MTLTTEQLDEIERKAKAATPGPWTAELDMFDESGIMASIASTHSAMLATINTDLQIENAEPWTDEASEKRDAQWAKARCGQEIKDAEHIAANSPDVTLRLVAVYRAALACVEAMERSDESLDTDEMVALQAAVRGEP